MYAGHFATALLAVRAAPKVPPWVPVVGVGLIDIVNAVLVGVGVDRVSPDMENELGFSLDAIDWDHSLVMAGVWALAFALLCRRDWMWARVAALAVFSHFLLDVLVHDPDMALWPGSAAHLGFEGWRLHPVGAWLGEFAYSFMCLGVLHQATVNGERLLPLLRCLGIGVLLMVLNVTFTPWWSPLRMAAALLSPAHATIAYSALVFGGFVVPAALLVKLLPAHR